MIGELHKAMRLLEELVQLVREIHREVTKP